MSDLAGTTRDRNATGADRGRLFGFSTPAVVLVALIGLGGPAPARAQIMTGLDHLFGPPRPPSRQVTVFGLLATPGDPTLDPKLKPIAPQLRRVFPGQGFRLLGAETHRLQVGQTLATDLGDGFVAGVQLLDALDRGGKAQLRFELDQQEELDFATIVVTPLNQLFFLEKKLPDGTRIIIGIGVRE